MTSKKSIGSDSSSTPHSVEFLRLNVRMKISFRLADGAPSKSPSKKQPLSIKTTFANALTIYSSETANPKVKNCITAASTSGACCGNWKAKYP